MSNIVVYGFVVGDEKTSRERRSNQLLYWGIWDDGFP